LHSAEDPEFSWNHQTGFTLVSNATAPADCCARRKPNESIAEDRKGFLFRTARGHNGTVLSGKAMSQPSLTEAGYSPLLNGAAPT